MNTAAQVFLGDEKLSVIDLSGTGLGEEWIDRSAYPTAGFKEEIVRLEWKGAEGLHDHCSCRYDFLRVAVVGAPR